MTARGDIENLMVLYTEALDDARFTDLGEVLADATVTIEGGPHDGARATGRHAVRDLYQAIVALDTDGRAGTRHFISNVFVQVDGARASARSYFAVSQQTATLPLQLVACGAYRDEYQCVDDVWRFATRHIVCDQVGDLRQHMR